MLVNLVGSEPALAAAGLTWAKAQTDLELICTSAPVKSREIQLWILPAFFFSIHSDFFLAAGSFRPFLLYGDLARMGPALKAGASDYLVDPWTWEEAGWRARRAAGLVRLDLPWGPAWWEGTRLVCEGRSTALNLTERLILQLLLGSGSQPVSRERLAAWLDSRHGAGRSLDVQVSRLRKKLLSLAPAGLEAADPVPNHRGLGWTWFKPDH